MDVSNSQEPINRVRRRDRAADDEWIRRFFKQASYVTVATECDGQPFINPVVFAYDAETHAIYFHTGRAGRIFGNISRNPKVCVCASAMGSIIPSARAAGYSVEYESAIAFGEAEVLEDEEEALRAMRLLMEKYAPDREYGVDYQPITPDQLARAAIYRVRVKAWSGKRNAGKPE